MNANLNNPENYIAAIRLARTRNIGPVTFLNLIRKYNSPVNALEQVTHIMKAKGILDNLVSEDDAHAEIEEAKKIGAKIITILDEEYPKLLSEIYDPPILLSCLGDVSLLRRKSLGVVGTRNASANGLSFTYKISKEIAEQNYVITSGLAKGVDTSAHKAAIETGAATIAVIAGGIDNIYPKENKKLYDEISEKGLIISENPFGALPKSESFPRRNRIISGLSLGILVVEAALKSGSLITARFANEQGREIFAVPGFPMDPRAEGPNDLIKNGATLVTSSKDILSELRNISEEKIIRRVVSNKGNLLLDESIQFEMDENIFSDANNIAENSDDEKSIADSVEEDNLNENSENKILKFVSYSPIEIDELVRVTKLNPAKLNTLLLELEISGEITRHPGNKVAKVA